MSYKINRVAVVGSGTMGGGIAAHLANAGIPVYLLDIAPQSLTPEEQAKGLALTAPQVRNRIVRQGMERVMKARPEHLFTPKTAELITTGNLEDNFTWLGQADWIIEAVVENLPVKQDLMARIDGIRLPDTIVSSNTSGIPIASIAEGRSDSFRRHFMGTHFFNPPRYMKLLEVIPTADTDPAAVEFITTFAEDVLGKGVVLAKDRPNFIANRIGTLAGAASFYYALQNGYTVEEVDMITGPLIGNPKTASFRLRDLVGLDIVADVLQNLLTALAEDEMRAFFQVPDVMKQMIERGWLGNKTGQGFYKRGPDGQFWPLNLETLEYEPPKKPRFPAVGQVRNLEDLGDRLRGLYANPEDRAGKFFRITILTVLAYASRHAAEIADDIVSIDRAMRWGFGQEMGPFEMWDTLGVRRVALDMQAEFIPSAGWVQEMLATSGEVFYPRDASGQITDYYDFRGGVYRPIKQDPRVISLGQVRTRRRELRRNDSASLLDLGDGVLCLEFHSKMNSLDQDIATMTFEALDMLEKAQWAGMVIGNQGENFSVGANLGMVGFAAAAGQFDMLAEAVRLSQDAMMATRFSPKPVVTAPFGMALGGGAEVAMQASAAVAAAETYMGLVEVGVGLIPGSGGCKEMIRRKVSPHIVANTDPVVYLQPIFEQIALAKVSTSAAAAQEMGYLRATDRIIMNKDILLDAAKKQVLEMAAEGYKPPVAGEKNIYAAGRRALAAIKSGVQQMLWGHYISEYDAFLAGKLAYVLCGGELSSPQWVTEQYLLDLEREVFLSLLGEEKTRQRISHMLETGKPLRN